MSWNIEQTYVIENTTMEQSLEDKYQQTLVKVLKTKLIGH
jgi:hypothetical protein